MTKGERTRARILATTSGLINRQGLRNTSIQDIIDETGVKKGNLYFHFHSKDDLGLSLLQEEADRYFDYLTKSVKSSDPLGKIVDTLNAVRKVHRRKEFVGGCIFGNTALEMCDTNSVYTELLQGIFDRWVQNLARYLREAVALGLLSDDIKPNALARHIVASMEGSIMMARLYKREKPIVECIGYVKTLLGME